MRSLMHIALSLLNAIASNVKGDANAEELNSCNKDGFLPSFE